MKTLPQTEFGNRYPVTTKGFVFSPTTQKKHKDTVNQFDGNLAELAELVTHYRTLAATHNEYFKIIKQIRKMLDGATDLEKVNSDITAILNKYQYFSEVKMAEIISA